MSPRPCPPATSGQEVHAVPRGPSEGGGRLGRSDCPGGLENAQEGGQVGCQFLERLTKTPKADHLGERLTFPCVADKGQEIPQFR